MQREHPPPADPPGLRIALPLQLEGVRKAEIIRGTGLAENTVAALLNREHPPTRLSGETLAAMLDFISQRTGRAVSPGKLLVYDPPDQVPDCGGPQVVQRDAPPPMAVSASPPKSGPNHGAATFTRNG